MTPARAELSLQERQGPKVEQKIEELLAELSLDEKIGMVHGNGKFTAGGVPRLGIPELTLSDGPHGVRREIKKHAWEPAEGFDDEATYLPTGTAQAATFSRNCARTAGSVLGAEARDRKKDIILGPGVNIVRDPLCGRNFEYYTEDPFLAQELVVAAVEGIQSEDTAACVKHYACNSQELNRLRVNARVDERTLREIYLPSFEAAVIRGQCLTVMGAYNQVRGQQACHHKYLVLDVLKREWGFSGLYMSDWDGATNTHESVLFGLDLEMGTNKPYEDYYLSDPYRRALAEGVYTSAELDDKVRRILRVMFRVGVFDRERKQGGRNTKSHQRAAYEIAAEAVVLLKNDQALLPFPKSTRLLAVIGDNAKVRHAGGGNSSAVRALYEVTPLEGLEKKLGGATEIAYVRGYPDNALGFEDIPAEILATRDPGSGVKGWRRQGYPSAEPQGHPAWQGFVDTVDADYARDGLPETLAGRPFSVTYSAEMVAAEAGTYTFGVHTDGACRVLIDEELKVASDVELGAPSTLECEAQFEAGSRHSIAVEFRSVEKGRRIRLGYRRPGQIPSFDNGIDAAVALAKRADAVIIFGGLNHFHDTEGKDRSDHALPMGQDALIDRVLDANRNTAVVLLGGSPVAMPWVDKARAVLWGWYGGMEAGNALADVLFGDVNPSGKLPFTFPKRLGDSPSRALDDYRAEECDYKEGVLVGYRWFDHRGIEPLFPFGHGLSYTTFSLSGLEVNRLADRSVRVSVELTNTGLVRGAEVVQVYVEDEVASVRRPPRELKGFEKVWLDPGETARVSIDLSERAFAFWNDDLPGWQVEPGVFVLHVGSSSRNLPLAARVELS